MPVDRGLDRHGPIWDVWDVLRHLRCLVWLEELRRGARSGPDGRQKYLTTGRKQGTRREHAHSPVGTIGPSKCNAYVVLATVTVLYSVSFRRLCNRRLGGTVSFNNSKQRLRALFGPLALIGSAPTSIVVGW